MASYDSYTTTVLLLSLFLYVSLVKAATKTTVGSNEELQKALDSADPGDVITVSNGAKLTGRFICKGSGTSSAPITVQGANGESLSIRGNKKGTAFTVLGDHWRIRTLSINDYDEGFDIKGANNMVTGVILNRVKKGVDITGDRAVLTGLVVNDDYPLAYGIRVAGSHVLITGNVVHNNGGVAILLEETSCCGKLDGNVANGAVHLKGSKYLFNGGAISEKLEISGCQNSIHGTGGSPPVIKKDCGNKVVVG